MELDIATLISQYAFPIVACVVMAWYVKYTGDQNRSDLLNIRKEHEQETDKLAEAINNNTLAITKLLTLLGDHYEENN